LTGFVLDASVAIAWCFKDERVGYALDVLGRVAAGLEAIAPAIWPFEIINACFIAERRGRITAADSLEYMNLIESLPVTIETMPLSRTFDAVGNVSRIFGLTAYDASYLELAMREGLPLATLDAQLRTAARKTGVSIRIG
jgi:predicted nucleic acid-binding protein